jgi:acyl-homoserine lactone acylase PvdQ
MKLRKPGTRRYYVLLAVGVALALALVAGVVSARRAVRRGWPQRQGEVTLAGLQAPVTVVRDGYGVPHIYAQNEADLYFAQGYVHAQDRFWQMELNRRRGQGTLAEVLGQGAQATDAAWRNLNLVVRARGELAALEVEGRAALQAYAAGVQAWQERRRWPLEFTLLRWRGRAVDAPAPWTVEDSLVVWQVLSWQVEAQQPDPSLAARIVERVGPERGAFLLGGPLEPPSEARGALPERWALGARVVQVSGEQTGSGEPLCAVDLPSDLSLPAPWYVMAWRVGDTGAAGASAPGWPGLMAGTGEGVSPEIARSRIIIGEGGPKTVEDLIARQVDTFSTRAARLVPLLLEVKPQGWRQERVTAMLRQWDYHVGDNGKEAPFFVVYQFELARAALGDELGEALFEAFAAQGDLYQAALDRLIEDPGAAWWDDVTTPGRESRADILERAYEPALEWIGRNYGDLHMLWEWDIVHGSRLQHPLGEVWPWDQLLNADLAPDGWSDTNNASPGGGPLDAGGEHFRARAVYGYRQIVDLGDPSTLWFALLPGQSGHPFHAHYDDLADEWLAGEYLPLRLAPSPQEVAGAESVLVLKPGNQ